MLSNAYLLAKFRFDTTENEPAKILQNFAIGLEALHPREPRGEPAARGQDLGGNGGLGR